MTVLRSKQARINESVALAIDALAADHHAKGPSGHLRHASKDRATIRVGLSLDRYFFDRTVKLIDRFKLCCVDRFLAVKLRPDEVSSSLRRLARNRRRTRVWAEKKLLELKADKTKL